MRIGRLLEPQLRGDARKPSRDHDQQHTHARTHINTDTYARSPTCTLTHAASETLTHTHTRIHIVQRRAVITFSNIARALSRTANGSSFDCGTWRRTNATCQRVSQWMARQYEHED